MRDNDMFEVKLENLLANNLYRAIIPYATTILHIQGKLFTLLAD